MSFQIDDSSIFTSQYLYKAAILFAVVRWIISAIFKFIDSSSSSDTTTSSVSGQMIRDSLELTTYGDLSVSSSSSCECAVCLNRMEEDDAVRRLRCCHVFHAECLDKWIEYDHEHVTCPLCRSALVGVGRLDDGLRIGPVKSEPIWTVERMLYLFGEDDNLYMCEF